MTKAGSFHLPKCFYISHYSPEYFCKSGSKSITTTRVLPLYKEPDVEKEKENPQWDYSKLVR